MNGAAMSEQAATFDQLSSGEECVLVVSGELDAASAGSFADAAYPHIDTPQHLVFDLQAVSFMDSSGLKVLATVAACRTSRGGVVVRNPCEQIRRLLKVAGMTHVLTVEPPLEQHCSVAG
jgi:anti-anti-sigma factor